MWDLCALIARSSGFCGSSLHGRIVATAFARPRLNVLPSGQVTGSKHAAYADAWELSHWPGVVPPEHLASALRTALAVEPARLAAHAATLAAAYRRGADRLLAVLA